MARLQFRVRWLCFILFLFGIYQVHRLIKLQVVENKEWTRQAVKQRSNGLILYDRRGEIKDRFGKSLTDREYHTCLVAFPSLFSEEERNKIVEVIGDSKFGLLSPVIINNPDEKVLSLYTENKPGFALCSIPLRYSSKPLANHLLGYLDPTGRKGISGLEYLYQDSLAGDHAVKLALITDAYRSPIPGLGWRYQEISGGKVHKHLVLTIDLSWQLVVEEVMEEMSIRKGAIILLETGSGKIRAMASRPVFDPYNPEKSMNDHNQPFLNRALQPYPPGPLLRMLVAAAALEEGKITPGTVFHDPGYIDLGKERYYCSHHNQGGHGVITFTQALAYGCDPVILKVAQMIGQERLIFMAKHFGLGKSTALAVLGESVGYLPSGIEKEDFPNFILGEQGILTTPLQIAGAFQIVAGNGYYYPPAVVEGIQEINGEWCEQFWPPEGRKVLSDKTVAELRKMLESVVLYGTGQKAQISQGVAGQAGRISTGKIKNGEMTYYGWFAGFTPVFAPRLVGVVFLEDDLLGGERAAEIFSLLMSRVWEGIK